MKTLASLKLLLLLVLPLMETLAQSPTQTIRGVVVDKDAQFGIIGANVIIIGTDPLIGASTDVDGNFRIENVPIGRQSIKVSYMGYEDSFVSKIQDYSNRKNQFNIGIGANYMKTLDFQYSTKTFQTLRTNATLGYNNRWKKGIFSSSINVFLGNLSPTSGPSLDFYARETDINGVETVDSLKIKLSQLGFNLEIGYLHDLKNLATSKVALYLGGSIEESLTYAPGFMNIGTINYAALNAKVRFDYFLRNGKPIMFQLSVPVVSVVTRMPYHNSPNIPGKSGFASFFTDNNHIETLTHFQNFLFSAKYRWLVMKKCALDVTYEASWLHYYRPGHLSVAGSQLILGFNF